MKYNMISSDRLNAVKIMILSVILLSGIVGCRGRLDTSSSPVDLYVNAITLHQMERNEEAIEKLDAAIEKKEDFSLAHSLKGDIYQQMQQYRQSAAAYEEAAKLNSWSFHDFFNLGRVYQAMMKFTAAVSAYARACELEPNNLQAHINTADCLRQLQQYDSALVYGRRAEQIDPNMPQLQEILGNIYDKNQHYKQAISAYKRALELDSGNTELMTSLAVSYLKLDRAEDSKELLTSAVTLDPDNGRAFRHLGYCYLKLYESLAADYRLACQQGSADSEHLESLKRDRKQLMEMALENYKRAVDIDEADWDAQRGLGVAHVIAGKTDDGTVGQINRDKAIFHWRRSLQINPDQPRAEALRDLIAKYRRN